MLKDYNGSSQEHATTHVEVNFDNANLTNGNIAEEEQGIELMPTVIYGGKPFAAVPITPDDEAAPLRAVDSLTNGHKLKGAENTGNGVTEVDSPSNDADDYQSSKKCCPCWDVRCVLMGLLILLIVVGGSIMAIMARSDNEPGRCMCNACRVCYCTVICCSILRV